MKNRLTALGWILGGIVAAVAIGVAFNQLLAPRQAMLASEHPEAPDYERIAEVITGTTVMKDLEGYAALGSRFTGSDGFYATADFVDSYAMVTQQLIKPEFVVWAASGSCGDCRKVWSEFGSANDRIRGM